MYYQFNICVLTEKKILPNSTSLPIYFNLKNYQETDYNFSSEILQNVILMNKITSSINLAPYKKDQTCLLKCSKKSGEHCDLCSPAKFNFIMGTIPWKNHEIGTLSFNLNLDGNRDRESGINNFKYTFKYKFNFFNFSCGVLTGLSLC